MPNWQVPLFNRYDLSIEFDRQVGLIRRAIAEDWRTYSHWPEAKVIERFNAELVIPIELDVEAACMSRLGDTLYRYAVPFDGDDELWHLYPVAVVDGVMGELFRCELLLECHAGSASRARRIFDERLAETSAIVELQRQPIRGFASALPSLIAGEIAKIRRPPPTMPLQLLQ